MMVLALELAERGFILEGLAVALAFYTYLRPGELGRLLAYQIVQPLSWSPQTGSYLTVMIDPAEDLRPGKTGEFDHSVSLDLPEHGWLAALLSDHRDRLQPREPLWPFSPAELRTRYQEIGTALLGVRHAPVLHQLRHGGASHDLVGQRRFLKSIQQRGNWRSPLSVRRYDKHPSGTRPVAPLAALTLASRRAGGPTH